MIDSVKIAELNVATDFVSPPIPAVSEKFGCCCCEIHRLDRHSFDFRQFFLVRVSAGIATNEND